jgi:hypothetical protein
MAMYANLLILAGLCAINSSVAQQADQTFGHSQVEQFICDRPGVGDVINREPALRAFLESGFAGELTGQRVYWDSREPVAAISERIPAYTEYPSLVRVSGNRPNSAIDKCMMLVFELQHGPFEKNRESLFNMAMRRQISRTDFARSCVRLEFQASRKTQQFFHKHPLADENSKENPHYVSTMRIPSEFSEYIQSLEGPNSEKDNILQYYLGYYDEFVSAPLRNGAVIITVPK